MDKTEKRAILVDLENVFLDDFVYIVESCRKKEIDRLKSLYKLEVISVEKYSEKEFQDNMKKSVMNELTTYFDNKCNENLDNFNCNNMSKELFNLKMEALFQFRVTIVEDVMTDERPVKNKAKKN